MRREIAEMYKEGLSALPISLPHFEDDRFNDAYQNYVIRSNSRDDLVSHLRKESIEVLISWPKPVYHNLALGLSHYSLPETEKICREVVSLPMNTEITDDQI